METTPNRFRNLSPAQRRAERIQSMFRMTEMNRSFFEPAPTKELLEWLRKKIARRTAIVVRTSTGQLAEALGIPAIDAYPPHPQCAEFAGDRQIEVIDSIEAFRKYQPDVVIACGAFPVIADYNEDGSVRTTGACDLEIALHCQSFIYIGSSTPSGDSQMRHRMLYHRPSMILMDKPWLFGAHLADPSFITVWHQKALLRQTESRTYWVVFLSFASEYVFAKERAARRIPNHLLNEAGFDCVRKVLFAAAELSDNGRQALTWLLYAKPADLGSKTPIDLIWANRTGDVLAYLSHQRALFPTEDGTPPQADIAIGLLRENPPTSLHRRPAVSAT